MGGWVTCPTYHSPVLVSKPKAQGQEQQRRGGVASASLRSHRSPNSQALAPHFMEPRSRAGGVYEGRGCVELRNKKKVISILQSHWLSAGPALHTPAPLGCPGLAGFCTVCSCRGRCCASVPGGRAPSEPRAGNREPGSREPRAESQLPAEVLPRASGSISVLRTPRPAPSGFCAKPGPVGSGSDSFILFWKKGTSPA